MYVKQFYLGCLAHASYLIADEQTRTAVVLDPQRDVQIYLDEAHRHGFKIGYVFLSHFHADFLAGHLELRERAGAVICLGSEAKAEYAFRAFKDGEALEVGRTRLQVIHTPGHTPESITLLGFDLNIDAEHPVAAFTGDTLFIGDVGRPDLRAALGWSAQQLGAMLYDSVHRKLLPKLPEATLIYPAHGAGSLCGKSLSKETVSTAGEQRRLNYALRPMSEAQFLALVLADQPEAPAYFTYDAVLNTRERATLDSSLNRMLQSMTLEAVLAGQAGGLQVLDTRPAAAFARGHLRGVLHIGLDGQFATWCGSVLNREKQIILIAEPGREREAAVRLGRIGYDRIEGYLDQGMAALKDHPDLISEYRRLSAREVIDELAAPAPPLVVDVRNPGELTNGAIDGSVNIPLAHLTERREELPAGRPLVVHCAGGYRSAIAASLLQSWGHDDVAELEGGFGAWKAAQNPEPLLA